MKRTNARLLIALALLLESASFLACEAETGPDAPPRQNGCIDINCNVTPTPGPDASEPDAT